jgi:dTDP-4-amino-4,6-dideoxygalactose transaminase
VIFSPTTQIPIRNICICFTQKNSSSYYYYPGVSHPRQRVVLFAPIKQERETQREREKEAHHLCTLLKENQNFTGKNTQSFVPAGKLIIKAITMPQFPSLSSDAVQSIISKASS